VDRVLREPPALSTAVLDAVPVLLPAARAADQSTRFLLVEIDRQGADLTWSDGTGPRPAAKEVVEGGHDVLHKVREGGGWGERRVQTRAEDSWERNAGVVAADLEKQVAERCPEIVLVTGDVRAVGLLRDAVGAKVREVLVEVPGGSRADGVNQQAFKAKVGAALDAYRERRREAVLDRYRSEQGRGGAAVTALEDVVAVLQRGQVAELLLDDAATLPDSALHERRLGGRPGGARRAGRRGSRHAGGRGAAARGPGPGRGPDDRPGRRRGAGGRRRRGAALVGRLDAQRGGALAVPGPAPAAQGGLRGSRCAERAFSVGGCPVWATGNARSACEGACGVSRRGRCGTGCC
jgi:hypothetical protein